MNVGHTLQAMDFLTYRLIELEGSSKYWKLYRSDIPGGLFYLIIDNKVVLVTSYEHFLQKVIS